VHAIFADADVDAANLELVLAPELKTRQDFWGGKVARIDLDLCSGCGTCETVCRYDAIQDGGEAEYTPVVDPIACEGCGACVYQCPEEAIHMEELIAGEWYHSQSRYGPLFHANLHPAQENSGKLVTLVKQQAKQMAEDENASLVLVDGPPGIGCPVISAVSGADLALVVVEPSVAGVHDMQRALKTIFHFEVQALVCINKADLFPEGTKEIETFCLEENIPLVGKIPFDQSVTQAMVNGEPITVFMPDSPPSQAIQDIWNKVLEILNTQE
jgi:MinD superfamily P-loop ATPase